jgi:hypothetical protein
MRRARSVATLALAAALATALAAGAWAEKPPALNEDAPAPVAVPPPAAPAPPAPPALVQVAPIYVPATAPGSHVGHEHAVTGAPAPAGAAITGDMNDLAPSERLAGREAALRFRFQQQLQSGDVPWTLRNWRN